MASDLRFFAPKSLATFRAAAACIVPAEGGAPGADADEALLVVDRALAARPARDQRLLRAFLSALELLPILRHGRPFSKLGLDQRAAFLRFLESNRAVPALRQGFFGLKTFALMGHYGREATFAELGYPGPRLDAPYYRDRQART